MGTWGTGLYAGDFALDLRTTIAAVARLPFDAGRLVDLVCEQEPAAAMDENDEDHATFWLVLADQLARRSIDCARARDKAIDIIDRGQSTEILEKLGAGPADIRRRRRILDELRTRLLAPPSPRATRKVLKKPQPLLMHVGDVLVYPTSSAHPANPYLAGLRAYNGAPWVHDGWGAAVIIACGRAFGFLAWYRPLTIVGVRSDKPDLASLRGEHAWKLGNAGTCPALQLRRMAVEIIGNLPIDGAKLAAELPGLVPGVRAAASDITIAAALGVMDAVRPSRTNRFVSGLGRVLED